LFEKERFEFRVLNVIRRIGKSFLPVAVDFNESTGLFDAISLPSLFV